MDLHLRPNQLTLLISAHFREIIRQPAVIFWGIIFPILIALGLGIAFTRQTDIVRHVAIVDDPATPAENGENTSRESVSLIDAMLDKHGEKIASTDSATPRYRITIADNTLGKTTFIFEKSDRRQAIVRLKRGNLAVIMDEQNGTIQYHFDPANTDAQFTYLKLSRLFNRTRDRGSGIPSNRPAPHPARHPVH